MIEVEESFQPTQEQLSQLLEGAEFLGEVDLHDMYFDFSDYRNFKKNIFLRRRNDGYELKVKRPDGARLEIEDEKSICEYLQVQGSLQSYIDLNLVPIIDYGNTRKKYEKDGFTIDVDSMDFGYELVEIELLVEDEVDIPTAQARVLSFAGNYGIEYKKLPAKREEYFRLKKPDIYRQLYG